MSFLLKDSVHGALIESVYNDVLTGRSNYYYYISRILEWVNPNIPELALNTQTYEYDTRNNIISVKKILLNDLSFVVPRINWTANTLYDQFDGNYNTDFLSSTGASSLKASKFYVLTNEFNVYKCLNNNYGALSTEKPFGTDLTPIKTSDGYVWKYMYTIPLSFRNKFLNRDFMPVQKAIFSRYYSPGAIDQVIVDNRGSGYSSNSQLSLTIDSTFLPESANNFIDISSVETSPQGVFFKQDGTQMFVVGNGSNIVNQFNLTQPWVVTTATYTQNVDVSAQDTSPTDIFFRDDGLKMYVLGQQGTDINEYNLSTGWDVSTATFNQSTANIASNTYGEVTPTGLFFKPDGTKMYVVGSTTQRVHEFSLLTPWSVPTASYTQNVSVAVRETAPQSVSFKPDGSRMYVTGSSGDDITEYSLGFEWNVASASFVTQSANLSTGVLATGETTPTGAYFRSDGKKVFIVGTEEDSVFGFDLLSDWNINSLTFIASTNETANLTPVLNQGGSFVDVVISNPGNNYSNASIIVTDFNGNGDSLYKNVKRVDVFSTGSGYTPDVRANTTVTISTTGSEQPNTNAVVSPIYCSSANSLIGYTILNPGSGYFTNVAANTNVTISTSGASQPTSNASANLVFSNSAILVPVISENKIVDVLIQDPGIGYSSNIQTKITLLGDGVGADLQPFVNNAGEIEDIIVLSRGEGYTYLDIEFIGSGANANAYAEFNTGEFDLKQASVEASALPGEIHAVRIKEGGLNYSQGRANVVITGDGSGFAANTVLGLNGSIVALEITNPGVGYTHASISIVGNGTGAIIEPILAPQGGHGKDAVKELFADSLTFFSTIDNELVQGIRIINDYRQVGLIKDVTQYKSDLFFEENLGSPCQLVVLDTTLNLEKDKEIALSNDANRKFLVVEVVPSSNSALLLSVNNSLLAPTNELYDLTTDTTYTVQTITKNPTINKFSGDLLFIDNVTKISYSDDQLVKLRTTIKL